MKFSEADAENKINDENIGEAPISIANIDEQLVENITTPQQSTFSKDVSDLPL